MTWHTLIGIRETTVQIVHFYGDERAAEVRAQRLSQDGMSWHVLDKAREIVVRTEVEETHVKP